jgi:hypothetical protein
MHLTTDAPDFADGSEAEFKIWDEDMPDEPFDRSNLPASESVVPGQFKLRPDEIRPLSPGHGACLATDLITVEGHEVGYMYRERSDEASDSGWRFFAGTETQAYLDQPKHTSVYDVNTIANYDPQIIPFLNSPIGSAFERQAPRGAFAPTEFPTP